MKNGKYTFGISKNYSKIFAYYCKYRELEYLDKLGELTEEKISDVFLKNLYKL